MHEWKAKITTRQKGKTAYCKEGDGMGIEGAKKWIYDYYAKTNPENIYGSCCELHFDSKNRCSNEQGGLNQLKELLVSNQYDLVRGKDCLILQTEEVTDAFIHAVANLTKAEDEKMVKSARILKKCMLMCRTLDLTDGLYLPAIESNIINNDRKVYAYNIEDGKIVILTGYLLRERE